MSRGQHFTSLAKLVLLASMFGREPDAILD